MVMFALVIIIIIFAVALCVRIMVSGIYSIGVGVYSIGAGSGRALDRMAQSGNRLKEWQDQVGLKLWRYLSYASYPIAFAVGWFAGWWIGLCVFFALSGILGILGLLYPYMRWQGYRKNQAAEQSARVLARIK